MNMKNPLYLVTLLIVFVMSLDYRLRTGMEGLPSVTIVEALSYIAIILVSARLAIDGDRFSGSIVAAHGGNRLVAYYFIWTGLASLATLVRSSDALRSYKDLFPSLVVYLLISVSSSDQKARKGIVIALLSGALLVLLAGALQSVTGIPRVTDLSGTAAFKTDFLGRSVGSRVATGSFLHPNGYAMYLLPLVIVEIALLFRSPSLRVAARVALVLLLLLTLWNLAFTYAKGVIVWVAGGIGLLLIIMHVRMPRTRVVLLLLTGGIAVITMYGVGALEAIGAPYGTLVTRLGLWRAGIQVIATDPFVLVLGNGFQAMETWSALYADFVYPDAHNTFINQVIYFGLPALLLYAGLAVQALRRLAVVLRDGDGSERTAASVLFSTIAALLGIYFFEPANEGVILQAEFFALLAFANGLCTANEEGSHATGTVPREQ